MEFASAFFKSVFAFNLASVPTYFPFFTFFVKFLALILTFVDFFCGLIVLEDYLSDSFTLGFIPSYSKKILTMRRAEQSKISKLGERRPINKKTK